MSCRTSAGSTKRVVVHAPLVPGIGIGVISRSFVTNGAGVCKSIHALVGLANPVEPGRVGLPVAECPCGTCWEVRVPARAELMRLVLDRQLQRTLDDEKHGLGDRVGLRPLAASTRTDLDDVLRERFRKSGQRPRDDP